MDLSDIIIYVDGQTEIESLKSKFKKEFSDATPCFSIGPGNGVDFTPKCYAKNIVPSIIANLKKNIKKVILIPDFEQRCKKKKFTFASFAEQIKKAVVDQLLSETEYKKDYLNDTIIVRPSNIMFENWIVCDIKGIKNTKLIKDNEQQKLYEGKNGTSVLKKIMTVPYKKTTHAKKLFKQVDITRGCSNSHSFESFVKTIDSLLKE